MLRSALRPMLRFVASVSAWVGASPMLRFVASVSASSGSSVGTSSDASICCFGQRFCLRQRRPLDAHTLSEQNDIFTAVGPKVS